MKYRTNFGLFLVSILAFITITSCSLGDDNANNDLPLPDTFTVNSIVELSDFLNTLEEALILTGLNNVLEGNGDFTLLAPSDQAFEAFLDGRELSDIPVEDLRELLLNHVIDGSITAVQFLADGNRYITTSASSSISSTNVSAFINVNGGGVIINGGSNNGGASLINGLADNQATNGIVHVVDGVITLPTIATFAIADPDLSTLVAALGTDGLTNDILTVISSPAQGAFTTVFAPNNIAFNNLLVELNANSLADIPLATLDAVLEYHASQPFNLRAEGLNDNQIINTLGSDTFTIAISNGNPTIVDGRNRTANFIITNIQATNGVMHTLDTVLLPPE